MKPAVDESKCFCSYTNSKGNRPGKNTLKVLMVGFGFVGQTFAQSLTTKKNSFPNFQRSLAEADTDIVVVGVVTRSHGCLLAQEGVDLERAMTSISSFSSSLSSSSSSSFPSDSPPSFLSSSSVSGHTGSCWSGLPGFQGYMTGEQVAQQADYDVLLELTTTTTTVNITTTNNNINNINYIDNKDSGRCGQPAITIIEHALSRGKHVVTANKGPVAFAYRRLTRLAAEWNGAGEGEEGGDLDPPLFLFEGTVMDGTPLFNLARHCLRGATVTEVCGILNSTSNFVLTEMEERGSSMSAALKIAQDRGIAEADPSSDINGSDAAVKIVCLANVLMGANVSPLEVNRGGNKQKGGVGNLGEGGGISGVTLAMVEEAKARGMRLKLIARAKLVPTAPRAACPESKRKTEDNGAEDGETKKKEGEGNEEGDGMNNDKDGAQTASVVECSVLLEEVPMFSPFGLVSGMGSMIRLSSDFMTDLSIHQDDPGLKDTCFAVVTDLLTIVDEEKLRRRRRRRRREEAVVGGGGVLEEAVKDGVAVSVKRQRKC